MLSRHDLVNKSAAVIGTYQGHKRESNKGRRPSMLSLQENNIEKCVPLKSHSLNAPANQASHRRIFFSSSETNPPGLIRPFHPISHFIFQRSSPPSIDSTIPHPHPFYLHYLQTQYNFLKCKNYFRLQEVLSKIEIVIKGRRYRLWKRAIETFTSNGSN